MCRVKSLVLFAALAAAYVPFLSFADPIDFSTNLLSNPSFEEGAPTAAGTYGWYAQVLSGGSGSGFGRATSKSTFCSATCEQGSYAGYLKSRAMMWQSFTLPAAGRVRVQWAATGRSNNLSHIICFNFDEPTVDTTRCDYIYQFTRTNVSSWDTRSFEVALAAGTHTLYVEAPITSTDQTTAFDYVAVFPAEGAGTCTLTVTESHCTTSYHTGAYTPGSDLPLTVTPDPGYRFIAWAGDLPSGFAPGTPTLNLKLVRDTSVAPQCAAETIISTSADLNDALVADPPRVITLAAGDYTLTQEYSLSQTVITGATGDFRDVTVTAASGKRAFTFADSTVCLSGITVSGGGGNAVESGAVIKMTTGSRLERCRITNAKLKRQGYGGGVYSDGGVLTDCVIDNCTAGGNIYGGLGLYQKGAGALADRCVITNNSYANFHAQTAPYGVAGVYIAGGTIRNSLIAFNSAGSCNEGATTGRNGFAVWLAAGATMDGCAVVENSISSHLADKPTAAVSVADATARLVNTVVANNLDSESFDLPLAGTVSGVVTSLVSTAVSGVGAGVKVEASGTYEWKNARYAPKSSSLAVDAGVRLAGFTYEKDLYGGNRVMGAALDMGPVETDPSAVDPEVSVKVEMPDAYVPAAAVFSAQVVGFPSGARTYAWTLDGEPVGSSATYEKTFTAPGVHRVAVTVTSGVVTRSDSAEVAILSRDVYLDAANAKPVYPYWSRETAATNIADVLSLVCADGRLHVSPGTYPMTKTFTVATSFRIIGEGTPADTAFVGNYACQLFSLEAAGASISNVTVRGGLRNLQLLNGAVAGNLRLLDARATRLQSGGVTYLSGSGSALRDSFVADSTGSGSVSDIVYGLGAYVGAGALVERCVFSNLTVKTIHRSGSHAQGTGVHIAGGTIRDSLVVDCHQTDGSEGADMVSAAGIYQSGGKVVNCTVVRCDAQSTTGGMSLQTSTANAAVNTIVWGNTNATPGSAIGNVQGNWATASAACLTDVDPQFRDFEKGNFTLRGSSPCRNAGDKTLYTGDLAGKDLAGWPRLRAREIDIGCYEGLSGLILLVR